MWTRSLQVALLSAPMFLVGCQQSKDGDDSGGPIEARANAQRTAGFAADIVRQLGGGIDFVTADGSTLDRLAGGSSAGMPAPRMALPAPLPHPLVTVLERSPGLKRMRPSPFLHFTTVDEDFDDTANDLEVFLRDRLLADANVESTTATQITYLLKPDPTCRALPSQGETEPATLDASCVADLMKVEVRIVVTQHGDGARFQVLVGPARHELSVITIHSDELAWEAGLASAKKATDHVNAALGKMMSATTFAKLEGRVGVSLRKLGEDKVSFATRVIEPVDVDSADADAAFRIAKSDPLFRITADGISETATLELNVGQVDVETTWDPKGSSAKNRDLRVSVGGIHGKVTLTEASRQVAFQGIGVRPSSVLVRGTKIFALAFNPGDGNAMDLIAKLMAGDVPRFEMKPKLDLSLMFNLQAIASDFEKPPAQAVSDETYGITLGGASPTVVEMLKANAATGFDGGLSVVAGTLALTARTAPAEAVTVTAGQCLVSRPMPPAGAHPMLGGLQSGACQ